MLKALHLLKSLKKSSSKEPEGKLEAKYYFHRQSWPKYMTQTLALA